MKKELSGAGECFLVNMYPVGNFTSNYDRTSHRTGSASGGTPSWHRSPSSRRGSDVSTGAQQRRPSLTSRSGSQGGPLRQTMSHTSGTGATAPADGQARSAPAIGETKEDPNSDSDDTQEVHRLARKYSEMSHPDAGADDNPFEATPGSSVDPASENFKARAWVKAMLKVHQGNEAYNKPRTAGVSFRNLSAFGYSASTDYQKTVGNYVLELTGLARRAMGHGPQKVDILRNCDGLVRAGEMLVVLGPPGSGCTTFLKTLAGETHGFKLSKETHLNYQGENGAIYLSLAMEID